MRNVFVTLCVMSTRFGIAPLGDDVAVPRDEAGGGSAILHGSDRRVERLSPPERRRQRQQHVLRAGTLVVDRRLHRVGELRRVHAGLGRRLVLPVEPLGEVNGGGRLRVRERRTLNRRAALAGERGAEDRRQGDGHRQNAVNAAAKHKCSSGRACSISSTRDEAFCRRERGARDRGCGCASACAGAGGRHAPRRFSRAPAHT